MYYSKQRFKPMLKFLYNWIKIACRKNLFQIYTRITSAIFIRLWKGSQCLNICILIDYKLCVVLYILLVSIRQYRQAEKSPKLYCTKNAFYRRRFLRGEVICFVVLIGYGVLMRFRIYQAIRHACVQIIKTPTELFSLNEKTVGAWEVRKSTNCM